ncbi:MAG: hypothetical protein LBG44_10110 [Gemmatimonadota bacterium]|nr:hypothetical protein [Gemmatimonadota bacterium]
MIDTVNADTMHWGAYEEYWYDALGRRVVCVRIVVAGIESKGARDIAEERVGGRMNRGLCVNVVYQRALKRGHGSR